MDTLLVYENIGHANYVVVWDTILYQTFGPWAITDVDNNGNKEIVLVGSAGNQGQVRLLESVGPGQYRYYNTNIFYSYPPFKLIEAEVKHNGRKCLVLLTSDSQPPPGADRTFVHVAEFSSKDVTTMWFGIQTAIYHPYAFDMAIGGDCQRGTTWQRGMSLALRAACTSRGLRQPERTAL